MTVQRFMNEKFGKDFFIYHYAETKYFTTKMETSDLNFRCAYNLFRLTKHVIDILKICSEIQISFVEINESQFRLYVN